MKRTCLSTVVIVSFLLASAVSTSVEAQSVATGTAQTDPVRSGSLSAGRAHLQITESGEQKTAADHGGDLTVTSSGLADSTILEIHTKPEGAEIYVDYIRYGESPKVLAGLEPGVHYLQLTKSGYYSESDWINVDENTRTVVSVGLRRITGFIHVIPVPKDMQIFLEGTKIGAGVTEVPTGMHVLTFRRFGYEDEKASIVVRERRTTTVEVSLEPAVFRLTDPTPSRQRLNPENHGSLGEMKLSFKASAPGNGTVEVKGPDGRTVLSHRMPSFTDWDQSFTWNGRDAGGIAVDDGEYTITVSGTGADGTTVSEFHVAVLVDRTAVIRYGTGLDGVSGLLYAPTSETLPSGNWQLSLNATGRQDSSFGGLFLPAQIFSRIGLTDSVELDLSGALLFTGTGTRGGLASAAIKFRLTDNDSFLRATPYLRGTVSSVPGIDTFTAVTGGAIGIPFEVALGPVDFILAPEAVVSPTRIEYGAVSHPAKAWFWGYLRTGIFFDNGDIRTGLSASFRTVPFSEGFSIEAPFQAGFEFHWLIPGTPFQLSFLLAGEFPSDGSIGLTAGGGFGLMN